jgi:hypothetical protein
MTAPAPRAPIEAKAQAAGVAGTVAGALIWVLQTYVFKGAMNPGLESLVYAAVPGVLALGAAWLAPHTPRPAPPTGTVTTAASNVTITPPAP